MSQVLHRAIKLLQLMAPDGDRREFGIKELAWKADLPLGTTHRILEALCQHGFVSQNPETRKYTLGWKLVELGLAVWRSSELRQVARPVMEELARRLEETIYLCVRDGLDGIYIEKVDSPLNLRITEPVGMRVPLHVGASKLVLLAYLPPSEQEEVITGLEARCKAAAGGLEAVPVNREVLAEQLERIIERGYSLTYGATTEGTAGLALPVRDAFGRVVASLSAAGPAVRYTEERIPKIFAALKDRVKDIEKLLGR